MITFNRTLAVSFSLLTLTTACAAPPQNEGNITQEEEATGESTSESSSTKEIIRIDGSSTVYPITDEIAQEYQLLDQENPEIQIDVSGTGGGFEKFCTGETDINNASRPIESDEMATCKENGVEFIELPVAYDAITIAVHPDNDWAEDITLEELEKLWQPSAQGEITTWKQVREDWPSRPIKLYGPGEDSGTFDYFTAAVVGAEGESRQDYTNSEDDTVLVRGVSQDEEALAYFGYSYYEESQGDLKALAVDSGSGPVEPSRETVRSGEYQPLSRPIFIYVNADSAQKEAVKEFVEYYLTEGRQAVKIVGSVPLPDEIYNIAFDNFQAGKIGTVFEGKPQSNLKMEELLEKEAEF